MERPESEWNMEINVKKRRGLPCVDRYEELYLESMYSCMVNLCIDQYQLEYTSLSLPAKTIKFLKEDEKGPLEKAHSLLEIQSRKLVFETDLIED